ncbi:MAG: TIGR00730 family Rossman fold protein [Ktedonobacterales bacterium]|nr:TIGR00730 family Rossman fold protein [Ktedonobacterales bacterium]
MSTPEARSVAVFCASRAGVADYRALAHALGVAMAAQGVTLIFGGGNSGLMGAVCDGVLSDGGTAIGVLPTFMQMKGWHSPECTELVLVADMHARKAWMESHADAFIILPGGIGTLDELITVMTTRQLAQHAKPIILLDPDDYYAPFMELLRHMISHGFLNDAITQMPERHPTPAAALAAIDRALAARP